MVKKLIKYDFKAFAKVMLPIETVLLGVALLYRIVSFFEEDSIFFNIFNVSTIIIFTIAIIAALLMTFIFSVVRFYKNLFTAEGYLSFTLPVTPSAHIASKLTVSLIFDVITFLTVIVSVAVATAGETFVEIVKAGVFLFDRAADMIGGQTALYVIEFVILALVSVAAAHLLTYMCVSIGQLASKHKVLLAFGIYFAVYVVKQIISTTFIASGAATDGFRHLADFIMENPRTSAHLALCGMILVELVLGTVYYIVSQNLIKKKLNLE